MNTQEITHYFMGITDIAAFMANCGIPAHKEAEVTTILKEAEYDWFRVEVSPFPTAFEQAQLDNVIQATSNKLAKL